MSQDRIDRVVHALKPFEPAVIYLFGSLGTESQHPGSDIDIAFLPNSTVDAEECFRVANHLTDELKNTVDLADLTHASTVFSKEVLRTGIPIHVENPNIYQGF